MIGRYENDRNAAPGVAEVRLAVFGADGLIRLLSTAPEAKLQRAATTIIQLTTENLAIEV